MFFFKKVVTPDKNKKVLVLKGMFSENTHVYVLTYQI